MFDEQISDLFEPCKSYMQAYAKRNKMDFHFDAHDGGHCYISFWSHSQCRGSIGVMPMPEQSDLQQRWFRISCNARPTRFPVTICNRQVAQVPASVAESDFVHNLQEGRDYLALCTAYFVDVGPVAYFSGVLKEGADWERSHAIFDLIILNTEPALSVVLEYMNDPDDIVRAVLSRNLKRVTVNRKAVIAALQALSRDTNQTIRLAAEDALRQMHGQIERKGP